MDYKVFKVSRCYCPEFIESDLFIEVANGVIVSISNKPYTTDYIDLSDFLVIPGFVDVHIHGFEGVDVNRDGIGGIKKMSKELPKTGVVAFLPTLVSDSKENILKILEDFNPNDDFEGAIPLGIHLEGVFINPKKHGAMDERFFVKPDIDYAKELIMHGNVRKFTVAPELENAIPLIKFLFDNGITVSLGHTDGTFEDFRLAYLNGANTVTHLFNAMSPFSHRSPNAVGATLYFNFYLEIIGDTHHTSKEVLALLKPFKDRLVLITDAIEATNLKDGIYKLGNYDVFVRDGTARLKDGTLAGSILTMDRGFKNLVKFGDFSFGDAAVSSSLNPSRSIGEKMLGDIKVGKFASFVCMDESLNVKKTIVKGKIVYEG